MGSVEGEGGGGGVPACAGVGGGGGGPSLKVGMVGGLGDGPGRHGVMGRLLCGYSRRVKAGNGGEETGTGC